MANFGSLVFEYPFACAVSSYLWDVMVQLDRLILQLRGLGLEIGTLKAIHIRSEQILQLTANRLSIIRASIEHGM